MSKNEFYVIGTDTDEKYGAMRIIGWRSPPSIYPTNKLNSWAWIGWTRIGLSWIDWGLDSRNCWYVWNSSVQIGETLMAGCSFGLLKSHSRLLKSPSHLPKSRFALLKSPRVPNSWSLVLSNKQMTTSPAAEVKTTQMIAPLVVAKPCFRD